MITSRSPMIPESVPQSHYQVSHGARHAHTSFSPGTPKGVTPKYSLKPLAPRLSELLRYNVEITNDCIGEEVEKKVAALPNREFLLLNNVRFYKEEEKNDPEFAEKLASLADDAFSTAHRAHISTKGVAKFLKPIVAEFLMQKELDYFVGAVANPKRPFVTIVGGSKVSSNIRVIESLFEKVNLLFLGGGMIFTFWKSQGYYVGSSLVEEDKLERETALMEKTKFKGDGRIVEIDVKELRKFVGFKRC